MTLPSPSLLERAESRIGKTIRDKYRIEHVLGVGGMATVYLATHRNGSRAALKILHPELAVHDAHRERFVREAYVANSIEHEGAVRVVDDDVAEDNCPFLVMELLDGETLEGRRRRLGRLDVREVLVLAYALCDTLGAAHDHGVVHRDIKPENIFLTRSGALKVLDFGIARVRHESGALGTRTGVMMGTPAFMPPEQALGRRAEIDARTDLWAVGATMFTLLSGRLVHEAESPEEMMVRAATQPSRSLREVLPEIPLPVAEIVDKALAFKREDRFSHAHAMRDAIAQTHENMFDEAIQATPMPSGPQSIPPPPRNSRSMPPPSLRVSRHSPMPSLRVPRNPVPSNLETLPEDGSGNLVTVPAPSDTRDDAAPTVVDRPSIRVGVISQGEVLEFDPTIAQPIAESLAVTRVEGIPPTHRAGEPLPSSRRKPEPVPMSRRTRRRQFVMALVGVLAMTVSVFVGVRHVVGKPFEQPKVPSTSVEHRDVGGSCKQHTDCAAGQRCDENSRCVLTNGCGSNAACIEENAGKPAICRRDVGRCVALETKWCRVFAEKADLQNDETVWVGAMYPERDNTTDYGVNSMRNIQMAREDFAKLTGGLPPAKSGGRPRPLAIVACDDVEDAEKTAEHLIDDVGVPAIMGFARSKEVLDLASRHFIPKGILALASNTASMISSIQHQPDQPRMVFRVTIHAEMASQPKAAVIREHIEPSLRAKGGVVDTNGTLKIAILRNENVSGTSHTDAIVTALKKRPSAADSAREEIRQFAFKDSLSEVGHDIDQRVIDEVIAFAPHIVVDGGIDPQVFVPVEKKWPSRLRYRPHYIIATSLDSSDESQLGSAHPTMPTRLFGIGLFDATSASHMYDVRYKGAFQDVTDGVNAASYDAFYVFAYAAMSLGQTPLTGTNLARAVKRLLPPGDPIDVGPSGIFPAFKALAAGRNIDLGGAQTSLDFDLETGDAATDFELFCFDRKAKTGKSSNLFYRARSNRLEGTWKCP